MQATENSDKGSVGNNALQDKTYGNDATARDSVGRVLKGSIPAKVTKYEVIYANARKQCRIMTIIGKKTRKNPSSPFQICCSGVVRHVARFRMGSGFFNEIAD